MACRKKNLTFVGDLAVKIPSFLDIDHVVGPRVRSENDGMIFATLILWKTGWWFGCHQFYFSIGNVTIPTDEL